MFKSKKRPQTSADYGTTRPLTIKSWLKKHQLSVAIILGALIITGIFLTALSMIKPQHSKPLNANKPKPAKVKYYSPLTGKEVADETATKQPVTAVMIENSPESRPQSGLKQAGAVYESVAEGGITRFVALYQQEKPQLIGPVRSLRMYYLEWATPYQASIAHVGGSYNALQEVGNGSHRDADQSFNAGSFWRASDRYAPHNMYTSFEKLDALNASKGYTESTFKSFERSDGKLSEEPSATSVTVNFSSASFNTSYTYNEETNSYDRFLAGAPHNDREDGQISPNVVVVLKVETQSRGGPDGYEDITTSGSGQAYVFQNGTVKELTWKKESMKEPLQLVDTEGKPFALNRGQTWIAAITGRGGVSWQ